jgi:PAS domain S-box-containing protein
VLAVLYVDDEPAMLDVAKLYLERSGFMSVDCATSAQAAIQMLDQKVYDAIISDYQMPGMDGIVFLQHVRKSSGVPFILFTGKGREEVVIEAINSGADFYLQKGTDAKSQFTELIHKIRQAVSRRQAELSHLESQQRLVNFINFLPDATFAIDSEGTVIVWNRAMEEMTGVPAGEIVGQGDYAYAIPFYGIRRPILIDLVMTPDPSTEAMYPFIRLEENRLVSEIYIPHLGTSGKGRHLWFIASPFKDLEGNLVGAIESIRDITEQKEVEEALRDSEERYRNVVESQNEFICRFTPDHVHIFVNDAYLRYFHKTRDELVGHQFAPPIPAGDRKRLRAHFASLTPANPVAVIEHRIIMPDGSIRWQGWSDRAIFGDNGRVLEFQSVGRDITERKQAENALKESEKIYRQLFESSTDGIMIGDSAGVLLDINQKACQMLGYCRDELVGKPSLHLFAERCQKKMDEVLERLHRDGHAEYETLLMHKDGREIPIEAQWRTISLRDAPALLCIYRDITERKRSEAAIRSREEQYFKVIDTSSDGIAIHQGGRIVFLNRAAVEILGGTSAGQLIGKPIIDLAHPDYRDVISIRSRQAVETAQEELQERFLTIDGRTVDVEVAAVPCTWNGADAVQVVFRDIGGRIASEKEGFNKKDSIFGQMPEKVIRSDEFQRSLLDASPDGICITDLSGSITYASPRIIHLFGGTKVEAVLGTNLLDWIAPDYREEARSNQQRVMRGETFPAATYQARLQDGTACYFEINSSVLHDPAGEVIGIVSIIRDVSDRIESAKALELANTKLRLLSSVTRHDILNQVTVLLGYLDIAESESNEPRVQELIGKSRSAAETINTHLIFTRDYQDIGTRKPRWQNLRDAITRATGSFMNSGISVAIDIPDADILADPLIEKVFYALADNSVRHGEKTKRIAFSIANSREGMVLVVADDGTGIGPANKEKIFTMGFGKNTGLGLFFAREMLGINGFTIRENGVFGEGARFEIHIPPQSIRLNQ